jgi:uncharacterized protein (DUF1330 family)
MPKAYAIFTEAITDPDGMKAYGRAAGPSVAKSGAKLLSADRDPIVLEGEWHGTRTVMMEFESVAAARAWYDSPEYQEAMPLRHAAAETNGVILTGLEVPDQRES